MFFVLPRSTMGFATMSCVCSTHGSRYSRALNSHLLQRTPLALFSLLPHAPLGSQPPSRAPPSLLLSLHFSLSLSRSASSRSACTLLSSSSRVSCALLCSRASCALLCYRASCALPSSPSHSSLNIFLRSLSFSPCSPRSCSPRSPRPVAPRSTSPLVNLLSPSAPHTTHLFLLLLPLALPVPRRCNTTSRCSAPFCSSQLFPAPHFLLLFFFLCAVPCSSVPPLARSSSFCLLPSSSSNRSSSLLCCCSSSFSFILSSSLLLVLTVYCTPLPLFLRSLCPLLSLATFFSTFSSKYTSSRPAPQCSSVVSSFLQTFVQLCHALQILTLLFLPHASHHLPHLFHLLLKTSLVSIRLLYLISAFRYPPHLLAHHRTHTVVQLRNLLLLRFTPFCPCVFLHLASCS